jgi:phospholipase/carboxylesterase
MVDTMERRDFVRSAVAGGAGLCLSLGFGTGCGAFGEQGPAGVGRLTARPHGKPAKPSPGRQRLNLGGDRDGVLQVPPKVGDDPLPLMVLLHGASGSGERMLDRLGSVPDDLGVAVVAPDSRSGTWDAIRVGFGPDVTFLDSMLNRVFERVPVDPARLTLGGFSDGATYALSLGLINGDLFPRIVAFSPGFVIDGEMHGKPKFFVSHGTTDHILPIDRCGRLIVSALKAHGYDVTFREFDGDHEVPPAVAKEALGWVA